MLTQEENFIKQLYQESLVKEEKKNEEKKMWSDIAQIMKRKDINQGEKAELRRLRKLEYFNTYGE